MKRSVQRETALSRWDNEGGAAATPSRPGLVALDTTSALPARASAELMQLRVRVIAMENLLITMLADAPGRQLERARGMALYISPRPGFTQHRLTLHAAAQMNHLVERAGHFRHTPPMRGRARAAPSRMPR
jgi:hypothetical protein